MLAAELLTAESPTPFGRESKHTLLVLRHAPTPFSLVEWISFTAVVVVVVAEAVGLVPVPVPVPGVEDVKNRYQNIIVKIIKLKRRRWLYITADCHKSPASFGRRK